MWVPKSIKQCVSHRQEIDQIKSWLKEYYNSRDTFKKSRKTKKGKAVSGTGKPNIVVWGGHGIGKSITVRLSIKDSGFKYVEINADTVDCKPKELDRFIINHISKYNKLGKIRKKKEKPTVYIIDNLDKVISNNEKNFCTRVAELNQTKWLAPIIFISGKNHNKLTNDIKKISETLKFGDPSIAEMQKVAADFIESKKVKISKDVFTMVVDSSDNDYRRLLDTLNDLVSIYKSPILENNYKEYLNNYHRKDLDYDIYEATDNIYTRINSIEESLDYYNTDKVLIPLMVHQNFSKYISSCVEKESHKIKACKGIIRSIMKGDLMENHIYSEQQWDLQDFHGFYSCCRPSLIMSSFRPGFKPRYEFPLDLNRTSIKHINRKNINNISKSNENMNGMDVKDYIYISKIVKPHLDVKELSEFVGNRYDSMGAVVKVDKIKSV